MLPWWVRFTPVLVLAIAGPAWADPLRYIPKEAGIIVVVENPRAIAEAVRDLGAYESAQSLPAVREALDATQVRRFFQLIAYYERELGMSWPNLLDKLAGKGIAVGAALGTEPAPALIVSEGTDEAMVGRFYTLILHVLEQEVARQATGNPDATATKLRTATHGGVATVHLGDDFHAARVGPRLYVANKLAALHKGLDVASGGSVADRPGPKAARDLLGGNPLAWLWVDFAQVKESKATRDFFAATRKDLFQTLFIGSSADAFRRADFIAAGLWQTPGGFRAALRLPVRRADLPSEFAVHVPLPGDAPGTLPLLEPKGVIYSQSIYLDLATLWTDRKRLVNEQQLKDIEKAERDISKVLPGATLGKLLEMSGPYHRFVVAHRDDVPYSVRPAQAIPPFAVVSSMRDPGYGKTLATVLRGAALLASTQTGMKMSEEKHAGVTIVSYRFPEKGKFPTPDNENARFNFVPCFAVVDEFLVTSSRPELIKDLIPELKKTPDPAKASTAVWRAQAYGAGSAAAIRGFPDAIVTQTILADGVGLEEAKQRVGQLADWLATLGTLGLEVDHQPHAYQIELNWKAKRK